MTKADEADDNKLNNGQLKFLLHRLSLIQSKKIKHRPVSLSFAVLPRLFDCRNSTGCAEHSFRWLLKRGIRSDICFAHPSQPSSSPSILEDNLRMSRELCGNT